MPKSLTAQRQVQSSAVSRTRLITHKHFITEGALCSGIIPSFKRKGEKEARWASLHSFQATAPLWIYGRWQHADKFTKRTKNPVRPCYKIACINLWGKAWVQRCLEKKLHKILKVIRIGEWLYFFIYPLRHCKMSIKRPWEKLGDLLRAMYTPHSSTRRWQQNPQFLSSVSYKTFPIHIWMNSAKGKRLLKPNSHIQKARLSPWLHLPPSEWLERQELEWGSHRLSRASNTDLGGVSAMPPTYWKIVQTEGNDPPIFPVLTFSMVLCLEGFIELIQSLSQPPTRSRHSYLHHKASCPPLDSRISFQKSADLLFKLHSPAMVSEAHSVQQPPLGWTKSAQPQAKHRTGCRAEQPVYRSLGMQFTRSKARPRIPNCSKAPQEHP